MWSPDKIGLDTTQTLTKESSTMIFGMIISKSDYFLNFFPSSNVYKTIDCYFTKCGPVFHKYTMYISYTETNLGSYIHRNSVSTSSVNVLTNKAC